MIVYYLVYKSHPPVSTRSHMNPIIHPKHLIPQRCILILSSNIYLCCFACIVTGFETIELYLQQAYVKLIKYAKSLATNLECMWSLACNQGVDTHLGACFRFLSITGASVLYVLCDKIEAILKYFHNH